MARFEHKGFIKIINKISFLILFLFISFLISKNTSAIVCLDEACVGCHVIGTAINISLTHPNLFLGCITCHSPECIPGIHKNGIRELDPLFYNFSGTVANTGCNVCHGAPPQAVCVGGVVSDHCLDPSGCNPAIFNCITCHSNFNGTSAHIYPKIPGVPPFAPVASISQCFGCHSLALFVGRSGAHATHFLTQLMEAPTTNSTGIKIGCGVCHPDLTVNLGADHLTCIPGTSNAWAPGKVPVLFDPLLPQIGLGDFYAPGLIGGTGSCVVYCHSNGLTPPTNALTAPLGYPGSFLPLPWNLPFPVDPITLDCGCCHAFPPITHTTTKSDCNQCHPTPVLSTGPTSAYHINGIVDLWKYLAALGPAIPLIVPNAPSPTPSSSFNLMGNLGLNISFPFNNPFTINEPSLLSSFNPLSGGVNPFMLSLPFQTMIPPQSFNFLSDFNTTNAFNAFSLLPTNYSGMPNLFANSLLNPMTNFFSTSFPPFSNLSLGGGYNFSLPSTSSWGLNFLNQPFGFSFNNMFNFPFFSNSFNFGGFRQPFFYF